MIKNATSPPKTRCGSNCCWARWRFPYRFAAAVPAGAGVHGSLAKGVVAFWNAIVEPDNLAAVWLSLIAAGIAVPLNCVFVLCCLGRREI
jgi:ABC-type sulfate transport system permease subunit